MAAMVEHDEIEPGQENDWEHEAEIPGSFVTAETIRTIPDNFTTPPRTVILTGATGFLGRQMLKRMIDDRISKRFIASLSANVPSFHHSSTRTRSTSIMATSQGPTLASLKRQSRAYLKKPIPSYTTAPTCPS
jgi:hypothetical protein